MEIGPTTKASGFTHYPNPIGTSLDFTLEVDLATASLIRPASYSLPTNIDKSSPAANGANLSSSQAL